MHASCGNFAVSVPELVVFILRVVLLLLCSVVLIVRVLNRSGFLFPVNLAFRFLSKIYYSELGDEVALTSPCEN